MEKRSTIIAALLVLCIYIPSWSQSSHYNTSDMVSCKLTDDESVKGNNILSVETSRKETFDIAVYKGDDGTLHVRVLGKNKVDIAMYIHNAEGEETFYEPVCVGGNGEIIYSLNNAASGTCVVTANNSNNKKEIIKKSVNF